MMQANAAAARSLSQITVADLLTHTRALPVEPA
jgi:hypothetical protein